MKRNHKKNQDFVYLSFHSLSNTFVQLERITNLLQQKPEQKQEYQQALNFD